jgi:hypothetical protein
MLESINLDDAPVLDFKKKFFYCDSNVSQTDPLQLQLMFADTRNKILNGSLSCSQEEAVQFAALLKTVDQKSK